MTMLVFSVFGLGLAVAAYAIFVTVAPNVARIGDALMRRGPKPTGFETFVLAERRIAVRRWAASSAPLPARLKTRAAA